MEKLFQHRMNILNLRTNVDSTGAVGNLFFIAPNGRVLMSVELANTKLSYEEHKINN